MDRLLAERERWPLWLPVFLGLGIAAYFAWPSEPPAWTVAPLIGSLFLAWARFRHWPWMPVLAAPVLALGLGFAVGQVRTVLVAAPVLERPSGKIVLTGTITEVEALAEGGQRVVLEDLEAAADTALPARARLRLKSNDPLPVGARIRLSAILVPPPQPLAPGAFDFARHAWFLGLGAIGTGLSAPDIVAPPGLDHGLNRLRHRITLRIAEILPGATGGVAAALITGETAGIPRAVLDDYRDSGLAHLLSISGLHMSLLAGMAFFVLRGGLALVPRVALRCPIKKWAAGAALLLTFLYMLLAGAPVPAQRAFLMTGIVLLAVMLDRSALSMRLVAWAAALVLLVSPEALIGPSFQMSFAAVAALIACYEVAAKPMAAWRSSHDGWHHRAAHYLVGVGLSTLVAGASTALYGAYHFNRFAVWSMLSNLLAVPITGIAVMPFAMLALVLMPFGLDPVALVPMGWGVDLCNWVAHQVGTLPAAAITLPVLPLWGMGLFTVGLVWLLLWRGAWRLWGVPVMVAGMSGFMLSVPPDLLVDGRGYAFGVRLNDGGLLVNRGGRILRETWDRRAGPLASERWPRKGRSADGSLSCDTLGCVWRIRGRVVSLIQDEAGIAAGCQRADVVVSAVPLRNACRGPRLVIDRFDLWRQGAMALWLEGYGVQSVAAWQGDRPWSHRPVRRKPKVQEPPVTPDEDSENDES